MKTTNDYAQMFGRLYASTPKAVFAAIVWSYVSSGGDVYTEPALQNFIAEWRVLHENGIVLQKPPTGA